MLSSLSMPKSDKELLWDRLLMDNDQNNEHEVETAPGATNPSELVMIPGWVGWMMLGRTSDLGFGALGGAANAGPTTMVDWETLRETADTAGTTMEEVAVRGGAAAALGTAMKDWVAFSDLLLVLHFALTWKLDWHWQWAAAAADHDDQQMLFLHRMKLWPWMLQPLHYLLQQA
jgi:hypothetical protein